MKHRDQHFYELIDMARGGDEAARADLFLGYDFDFDREGDPRDQLPTRKTNDSNNTHEES